MSLLNIIEKRILTIRSYRTDMRIKRDLRPEYILFDDRETYIELEDQDCYTYHDFAFSAKHINVYKNKGNWERMFDDLDHYPEANEGILTL